MSRLAVIVFVIGLLQFEIVKSMLVDRHHYRVYETLQSMQGKCLDFSSSETPFVKYIWCFADRVMEITLNPHTQKEYVKLIGNYMNLPSISAAIQVFHGENADCQQEDGALVESSAVVALKCCADGASPFEVDRSVHYIESMEERHACTFSMTVCTNMLCDLERGGHGGGSDDDDDSDNGIGSDGDIEETNKDVVGGVLELATDANANAGVAYVSDSRGKNGGSSDVQRPKHSFGAGDIEVSEVVDDPNLNRYANANNNRHYQNENDGFGDNSESTSNSDSDIESTSNSDSNSDSGSSSSDSRSYHFHNHHQGDAVVLISKEEQLMYRDHVKAMFYHGYNNYMEHAFPESELKPLSCTGGKFDLIKIPYVTLIDTLDTLVIMGDYDEFRKAVDLLEEKCQNFDYDVNISVFETTIRLLGGLLSAHLFAVDPRLNIYPTYDKPDINRHRRYNQQQQRRGVEIKPYKGSLLRLAIDLGNRLLPAFDTATGIPYGTVNLRSGVPKGETMISSTAAAGTLMMEFEVLSSLSGDSRYGDAASRATKGIYFRRSALGLLGKHINITSGRWTESISGIGSNSDSFYEYLLKSFLLFDRPEYFRMFTDAYAGVKHHMQIGDYFVDVDMFSGKLRDTRIENLQAFWPGIEAMMGFTDSSASILNSLYDIWLDIGVLPEDLYIGPWNPGRTNKLLYSEFQKKQGNFPSHHDGTNKEQAVLDKKISPTDQPMRYLLRPELIESTYHQYRSTNDRSWLTAGAWFLKSVEENCRSECGYASIISAAHDPMLREDEMPSYFLSETCKYLYLLFDEDNFIHDRPYVFSTEAHPFDVAQLKKLSRSHFSAEEQMDWFNEAHDVSKASGKGRLHAPMQATFDKSEFLTTAETSVHNNNHATHVNGARERARARAERRQAMMLAKAGATSTASTSTSTALVYNEADRKFGAEHLHGPNYGPLLPLLCYKKQWWEVKSTGFAPALLLHVAPLIEADGGAKRDYSDINIGSPVDKQTVTQVIGQLMGPNSLSTKITTNRILTAHKRQKARTEVELEALTVLKQKEFHKRHNRCAVADEAEEKEKAKRLAAAAAAATTTHTVPPGQQRKLNQNAAPVDIEMGALGGFTVSVQTEGFTVTSKRYGNTIDISNVGQSVVFVKDSLTQSKSFSAAMGDSSSNAVACKVRLVNRDEILNQFLRNHFNSFHAEKTDEGMRETFAAVYRKLQEDTADKYCSISSFDVASGSPFAITAHAFEVSAEIVFPPGPTGSDEILCEPPPAAPGAPAAGVPRKDGWFSWGSSAPAPAVTGADANSAEATTTAVASVLPVERAFENKIVLAKRGSCMFEDKALIAARHGAVGLIISNTDDSLFIMAGKKDGGVGGGAGAGKGDMKQEEEGARLLRHFPAVMLTKTDAEAVTGVMTYLKNQNIQPVFEMVVTSTPMSLDILTLGSSIYPKVHVLDKVIVVYSRADWGVVLTNVAAAGQEWQLFVLRRGDLGALTPWKLKSVAGLDMSGTPNYGHNPVELYARVLSRKCPTFLHVDAKSSSGGGGGTRVSVRKTVRKSPTSSAVII